MCCSTWNKSKTTEDFISFLMAAECISFIPWTCPTPEEKKEPSAQFPLFDSSAFYTLLLLLIPACVSCSKTCLIYIFFAKCQQVCFTFRVETGRGREGGSEGANLRIWGFALLFLKAQDHDHIIYSNLQLIYSSSSSQRKLWTGKPFPTTPTPTYLPRSGQSTN